VTKKRSSERHVLVRAEHPRGAYAARVLRQGAAPFLSVLPPGELSVALVTDAAIRRLNRDFRHKDKATDVLSFGQPPGSGLVGDVIISLDTARRQAKEGKRALCDELVRLLAHGVLHLAGHDHEQPADARRMAAAEVKLLGRAGLVAEALDHPAVLDFKRVRSSGARSPARTPGATRR
jgi:probable rRNA maturation factor